MLRCGEQKYICVFLVTQIQNIFITCTTLFLNFLNRALICVSVCVYVNDNRREGNG